MVTKKMMMKKGKDAIKKAMNSETAQKVMREERKIIGDLLIKLGKSLKEKKI